MKINPLKVYLKTLKVEIIQSILLEMGKDSMSNEMKNVGDNHCFVNEKECFLYEYVQSKR